MAKQIRSEGTSIQFRRDIGLSTPNGMAIQSAAGINSSDFLQIDTAEVMDVIYNDQHPDFLSNEDIGKVKIRIIISEKGSDETELSWAWPINPYIISYPIKSEIVYVINLLGKYFYLGNINYFNNINNNILPGISKSPTEPNTDDSNSYSKTSSTSPNSQQTNNDLGDTFINNNKKIKPVLPNEGDVIVRGRFGNNIRLGNNPKTNTPNVKITVGQSPDVNSSAELTHYIEDINTVPTSMWATTDEIIEIKPITKDKSYYLKSAKNAPAKFDNVQLIFNTDRVIWNAKKNEVFIFANKGIALNTNGYIAIDSNDTIGITTLDKLNIKPDGGVFIDAPKIILGKDATEPVVLGNKLVKILNELITAILNETHPTGSGPSGTPLNAAQFKTIQNKLERTILSKQNRTL